MISHLQIYDFDGTLFRTPDQPDGWSDADWWDSGVSLNPPVVPLNVGPEYWNDEVVEKMRSDLTTRSRRVVVLTGRTDHIYRTRVGTLLHAAGLTPNMLLLNDIGKDVHQHKIHKLWRLIQQFECVKTIEMWDDNSEGLEQYQAFVEAQGVEFIPHLAECEPMPVVALPEVA